MPDGTLPERSAAATTGMTMTSKILASAAGVERLTAGDVVLPQVEFVTNSDGNPFIDSFRERGLRVWAPERVLFCFDHVFQPEWMPVAAAQEHPRIKAFASEQGIPRENIYDFGRNGISHQIPVEAGWALPGTVAVGGDTQTATMGAVNCFAVPCLWGVVPVLLRGDIWMQVPECVEVVLTGELPAGCTGKDVGYRLLVDLAGQVNGRAIEIVGPGVASMSMDVRMAVANGAVQMGALSIIFPADDVLLAYLKGRARHEFTAVSPDSDAPYVLRHECDLGRIEPLVAGPHEIDLVRPLTDVAGLKISAANIGSCSSGRLSDLTLAAEVLRGRQVHPDVRLIITPISAETARLAAENGVTGTLLAAGATVTQPGCGACYHGNLSPLRLADGERCVSTSVETVRGRMGSLNAEIFLANAAVVAASAAEGIICGPVSLQTRRQQVLT